MIYRILVSDAETRKSFDIISMSKVLFPDIPLIIGQTENNSTLFKHLKRLYNSDVELLRTHVLTNFVSDLKKICDKFAEDKIIYLPVDEETQPCFYNFLKAFGSCNLIYLMPSFEKFETLRNKWTLNEFCSTNGVACPKHYNVSEIKELAEETYPLLLKPCVGSGAKGIVRLLSSKDLTQDVINITKSVPYLVQELIENGRDVKGAFFLYNKGKCVCCYMHERIRTSPPEGGVTVLSKASHNDRILAEGDKLLSKIGWTGLVMLEFLYDKKTDSYKIIEANPRLWGSIMLSEFSGANLLSNYIRICMNQEPIVNYNENSYIRWMFPVDILSYIKSGFTIKGFWKFEKNTCYINWTYSKKWSAIQYNLNALFSVKNIKRFFRH